MNKKIKSRIPRIILYVFLICLCIVMLAPFAWIISTSLRLPKDSFKLPPSFFPTSFHIENYKEVFKIFPFGLVLFNSLKIAVVVVVLNTFISTMAGYAFARIDFKGKDIIFIILLYGKK